MLAKALSPRQAAKAKGEKIYRRTQPCDKCGEVLRYTANAHCVKCKRSSAYIITKGWQEAAALGQVFYLSANPCKRCKTRKRYFIGRDCVACKKVYGAKQHGPEIEERNRVQLKKRKDTGAFAASQAINSEVRAGRLPRLSENWILCVDCGVNRATQYDHRDYNKPLEVETVCRSCNMRRGPAIPLNRKAAK